MKMMLNNMRVNLKMINENIINYIIIVLFILE